MGSTSTAQGQGPAGLGAAAGGLRPHRLFSIPEGVKHLDGLELARVTEAFRAWAERPRRSDVRVSRKRLWLIYMLLRFTGAKLGEVLGLDDSMDFDLDQGLVRFCTGTRRDNAAREVQLPEALVREISQVLDDPAFAAWRGRLFRMDPGHVRRKFYERAAECGLPKDCLNPNALRRSRAIELLREDVPLKVVQSILGHSTTDLTAAYLNFSEQDVKRIARHFLEAEKRKTSARNSFFGKITRVTAGDIQSLVELTTLSGRRVFSMVTNNSVAVLGLVEGAFASAVVKAPWVGLCAGDEPPATCAENLFQGQVETVNQGGISVEVIVRLPDGLRVCSIISAASARDLGLAQGDRVWVMFKSLSVILNVD
ncbi:MAG: TOBE domain-containing protein [Desulfovibrionaceae bacterium]|nr:TOBE domain-containing protein [Desulfovibrionaceae bacterium]